MIPVHRELVWDYEEPPADELWRLQRIFDFFPQYGRDRQIVAALLARLDELRGPPEAKELVRLYAEAHGLFG